MYNDFFAERLTALRMQKNVSAREMSLSIGQNDSYINRIENKLTLPSMQSFFYICEYLDITPEEFFRSGVKNPIKINEILSVLQQLNDAQLDTILAVAQGFLDASTSK